MKFIIKFGCVVAAISLFIPAIQAESAFLSLEDTYKLVLENNPQVSAWLAEYEALKSRYHSNLSPYDALAEIEASYADREQPRSIIFEPSVIKQAIYGASLSKLFTSDTFVGLNFDTVRTYDNSTFNVLNNRYETSIQAVLEQELLKGFWSGSNRRRLETVQTQVNVYELTLKRNLELLLADVSRLYWNLWRDNRLLTLSIQLEKEANELFGETARLAKKGLREEDDIMKTESALYQRQQEILINEKQYFDSWDQLKHAMGGSNAVEWVDPPNLEDPPSQTPTSNKNYLQEAYRQRADILALEKLKDVWEKYKASLRYKELPSLKATGGYSLVGLDPSFSGSWDQIEEEDYPGWNVGMALSHRFGQNHSKAEKYQAASEYMKTVSQYENLISRIEMDIRGAERNFNTQMKARDLSVKIENLQEKVEKINLRKYKIGRISLQELLITQESRRRAKYQRQTNEALLAVSQIQMATATGQLSNEDIDSWINKRWSE